MKYTSVDFDKEQLADYTLLVGVGQEESTLAIVDNEQQLKFIVTYHPADIDEEIRDILKLDFERVKIVLPCVGYSFIPAEVFDEAYLPVYRRYFTDDGLADPLVSDIPSLGIKLIHQISRIGAELFLERFPHAGIYSSAEVSLHAFAGYGTHASGYTFAIHKMGLSAGIYFFDSGKFRYGNDFEVHNADDLNYYLLSVLEHFGLENERPGMLLSGDIALEEEYHHRTNKHSDQVVFADIEQLTGIAIPAELQSSQHRFLSLFGLNLCG